MSVSHKAAKREEARESEGKGEKEGERKSGAGAQEVQ